MEKKSKKNKKTHIKNTENLPKKKGDKSKLLIMKIKFLVKNNKEDTKIKLPIQNLILK